MTTPVFILINEAIKMTYVNIKIRKASSVLICGDIEYELLPRGPIVSLFNHPDTGMVLCQKGETAINLRHDDDLSRWLPTDCTKQDLMVAWYWFSEGHRRGRMELE